MRPVLLLAFLSVGAAASAAERVTVLASSVDLPRAQQQRLARSAAAALRGASGLVVELGSVRKRPCGQLAKCLQAVAAGSREQVALVLDADLRQGELRVEAFWVDLPRGKVDRREVTAARNEDWELALRPAVEALIPEYARRGRGALTVSAEPGALIKVDGRPVGRAPLLAPVVLTAGAHLVDVLLPSGDAVLRRADVPEAAWLALSPPPPSRAGGPGGPSALLWTSYGAFGAGALSVAGALIAGAFYRRELAGTSPCSGVDRTCLSQDEVNARLDRGAVYARNANVLLGVGGALCAAGATLFGLELWRGGRP